MQAISHHSSRQGVRYLYVIVVHSGQLLARANDLGWGLVIPGGF